MRIRTYLLGAAALAVNSVTPSVVAGAEGGPGAFGLVGSYDTGLAGQGNTAAEVVAVKGDRMYVSNATATAVDIVDISDPSTPARLKRVDLSGFGAEVTGVAAGDGVVAAAVDRGTAPGVVVFFSPGGSNLRQVIVGAGPDMVTFTPDGDRLLVANEGEPSGYGPGTTDPPGSVSVIELQPRGRIAAHTIGFDDFDPGRSRSGELPAGVRIFGSSLPSLDLEPEYLTVSADGATAWVSLQENNAIARLDLESLTVETIFDLGFADHSAAGSGLDASDRDGVTNIRPWPNVRGMYQPDAIASFTVAGRTLLLTANEGDARDYPGLAEEGRVRAVTTDASFGAALRDNAALGRLTVTIRSPASAAPQSTVYAFGSRSFSVRDAATGALVADSGDDLERLVATILPGAFNANNDSNTADDRSDNKGPEPEAAATGAVGGRTYGFVGLERVGGVVVVDLTDPSAPAIIDYLVNRDFTRLPPGPDSGPEVIDFVDAAESPTGHPLIAVANEISGTVSLWSTGR